MFNEEENKILPYCFYNVDGLVLAKKLLGQYIVRKTHGLEGVFKIVETEAYRAPEDKGCHAYGNKKTPRTQTMFLSGGVAYIYLIYGMYHCLNVVAGPEGVAHAVLIRAVEPLNEDAFRMCEKNRKIKSSKVEHYTNGPGKLCQALEIDRSLDGHSLMEEGCLYIIEGEVPTNIQSTRRVNIDYAEEYRDKPWRFVIQGHPFVSPVKIK